MLTEINTNFLQASEYRQADAKNSVSKRSSGNVESDIAVIVPRYRIEPRLTVFTLAWVGFWTGVVVCAFALLLH